MHLGAAAGTDDAQGGRPPGDAPIGGLKLPHVTDAQRGEQAIELLGAEATRPPILAVRRARQLAVALGVLLEEGAQRGIGAHRSRGLLPTSEVADAAQRGVRRSAPDDLVVLGVPPAHRGVDRVHQHAGLREERLTAGRGDRGIGGRLLGGEPGVHLAVLLGAQEIGIAEVTRADLGEDLAPRGDGLRAQSLAWGAGEHLRRHQTAQQLLERKRLDDRELSLPIHCHVDPAPEDPVGKAVEGIAHAVLHPLHGQLAIPLSVDHHQIVGLSERRSRLIGKRQHSVRSLAKHLEVLGVLAVAFGDLPPLGGDRLPPRGRVGRFGLRQLEQDQQASVVEHMPGHAVHGADDVRLHPVASPFPECALLGDPVPIGKLQIGHLGEGEQGGGLELASAEADPRARGYSDAAIAHAIGHHGERGLPHDLHRLLPFHQANRHERRAACGEVDAVGVQELLGIVGRGRHLDGSPVSLGGGITEDLGGRQWRGKRRRWRWWRRRWRCFSGDRARLRRRATRGEGEEGRAEEHHRAAGRRGSHERGSEATRPRR